VERVEEEV
jgi:hypothetical protein